MKKLPTIAILAFLSMGSFAQADFQVSMEEANGILVSYDFSTHQIQNTYTDENFRQFYHEAFIGLIGPLNMWSGGDYMSSGYGAIGLVIGTAHKDYEMLISQGLNYYTSDGLRIVDYGSKTIGVIGGRVRFMGPTKARSPLLSKYVFLDLEYLAYRFDATVQKGGLGHYFYEQEKMSLNTISAQLGVKLAILKISGGIGYGFNLYDEDKKYENPSRYQTIKNGPESTNHLIFNVSAGIALDFIKW